MTPEEKAAQLERYAEGKRRYHARRAERKAERDNPLWKPREELTPEQQAAIRHIAVGLFELFLASVPARNDFPAELDVKEVDQ